MIGNAVGSGDPGNSCDRPERVSCWQRLQRLEADRVKKLWSGMVKIRMASIGGLLGAVG